ncbi:MAG: formylglycine-generating enzyme family protein [Phycisphaerae bacterium]|jgi:formylglycine-generating enzyme required for sulfatase activity|nr:formylglycine-generating enzyme family protein [Phycisphaerae bacterium]
MRILVLTGLLVLASAGGVSCQRRDETDNAKPPPVFTTKSGVEMLHLPGGSFQMGSASGQTDEGPVHRVQVDAFLMDKYEVTQDQFRRLEISDPSHFKGPRRPVEHATFAEVVEFCNERSLADGLTPCYQFDDEGRVLGCDFDADGYRLPTEAEWEYACRAGSDGKRFFAGGRRALGRYAWYGANAGKKTHPVGGKQPNAWGLHDMYGNVAEWCNDYYAPDYYKTSEEKNPRGPAGTRLMVVRGGAWNSSPDWCRSAARGGENPRVHDVCFTPDSLGFRCVRKVSRD